MPSIEMLAFALAVIGGGMLTASAMLLARDLPPALRYRRVGGLRFARMGRLQVSWCVVRESGR